VINLIALLNQFFGLYGVIQIYVTYLLTKNNVIQISNKAMYVDIYIYIYIYIYIIRPMYIHVYISRLKLAN